MRLARDRAGGCTPGEPLSCQRQERVRDRTGQAALLRAARAGGCTPGEPPSCLRQGRVRDRTGQAALLRAARAGGCTPRQAAFLPTARAESTILQLGRNTRTRAEDLHRPSVSERPQARSKVLCQAFFQESGGRLAGGGAGGVGEGGQLTGGVVHSPAEILRPLAVQLQNHRVSGEGFGAVVLADGHDFPV